MRTLIALAALVSAPASAADLGWQLSGELGNLRNADPSYDLFSKSNVMPSRGIRFGVTLADTLTVETGWHRVRRGLYSEEIDLQTAFFADEFMLGPKISHGFADVFYPYAAAHGVLMRGTMKFDDDTSTKRNAGQVVQRGLGLGVLTMGGVEFRSPTGADKLGVSVHIEAGYGWFQSADFGDIGTMKPGGFAMKGGVGIRL